MRVWIDLTNSPHVLVMRPVIRALERRGTDVLVTARDFAQTIGLCERFGIEHEAIGRHRGGRLGAKGLGLVDRSWELLRWARGRGFDLALGHGSNDVSVAAVALGTPVWTTFEGRLGAVDERLLADGRLRRLERPEDVVLRKRTPAAGVQ